MGSSSILVFFWLIGLVLGIVIFIYSLIFLITVPKHLKRIARALQVIALSMDDEYEEEDEEDDE